MGIEVLALLTWLPTLGNIYYTFVFSHDWEFLMDPRPHISVILRQPGDFLIRDSGKEVLELG